MVEQWYKFLNTERFNMQKHFIYQLMLKHILGLEGINDALMFEEEYNARM